MAATFDPQDVPATNGLDIVKLVAEDEHFSCRRRKLTAASTYFLAMFNSDMIESRSAEICLKEVDSSMLKILIDYAENDQTMLLLDCNNALGLLQCACMLQFDAAICEIEAYLLRNITCQNCCGVMTISGAYAQTALHNRATTKALWYFDEISLLSEILELSYSVFRDYITNDSLKTNSEGNVFRVVERWVSCNETERRIHLSDLLSCVHWDAVSESEMERLLKSPLISNDEKSKMFMQNAWECHKGSKHDKSFSRYPPETLVVVGGEWLHDDEENTSVFNPHLLAYEHGKNSPNILTSLPEDYSSIWGHQVCTQGKDLYLVGGEKQGKGMRKDWHNTVWHYDSLNEAWRAMTELPTPRRHHSVVVSGQYIYVIGGFSRHRIVQNTVDRYDTVRDIWEQQPTLQRALYSAAACCCNDSIYVISDNIEILYPGGTAWQQNSGIFPNGMHINWAISHRTNIYMMGIYAYTLYVLDTVSNQFTELGDFKQCCMGRACRISNKIFVVGGEDSHLMESYDIDNGTFSVEYNLDHEIKTHQVVALPNYPMNR